MYEQPIYCRITNKENIYYGKILKYESHFSSEMVFLITVDGKQLFSTNDFEMVGNGKEFEERMIKNGKKYLENVIKEMEAIHGISVVSEMTAVIYAEGGLLGKGIQCLESEFLSEEHIIENQKKDQEYLASLSEDERNYVILSRKFDNSYSRSR